MALDIEEIDRFHTDGFVGPFAAMAPAEMASLRPAITELLASDPDPYPEQGFHARHVPKNHNRFLDSELAFSLSTHPAIVDAATSIYGEDLLLWRAHFFDKGPGGKEIPWHQDYAYWPLEPAVIISAWLAIDLVTAENSCMQIVPGSHRRLIPHVKATPDMAFLEMADPDLVDEAIDELGPPVDIELEPGQFILFNERVLHHSNANRSELPRCGLSIRLVPPMVKVLTYDSQNHALPIVSGTDRLGFNQTWPLLD